jgi:hypothetical protein
MSLSHDILNHLTQSTAELYLFSDDYFNTLLYHLNFWPVSLHFTHYQTIFFTFLSQKKFKTSFYFISHQSIPSSFLLSKFFTKHTSSRVFNSMAVDKNLFIRKHAISELETKRIYQVQHSAFDSLREFYLSFGYSILLWNSFIGKLK